MTTTEAVMHFETKTTDGISRTSCFDANREELAGSLNFAESAWRSNPKKCTAAAALPLVHIPAALDAMPADLLNLPDDAQIVARREIARYDTVEKAGKVRAEVADGIERHAAGLFNAHEVAFWLEQQGGPRSNRDTLFKMLTDAVASGKLVTFDPDEDLPSDAARLDHVAHILGVRSLGGHLAHRQYLRIDVVNQWLASTGTARRLQPPAALAAPAATPVVSAPAVAHPESVAATVEVEPEGCEDEAATLLNSLPKSRWKELRSNRWTKAAKDQMRAMRATHTDAQIAKAFELKHARQVGNLIDSRSANKSQATDASHKDHRKIINGCIESSAVIGSASGHRIT